MAGRQVADYFFDGTAKSVSDEDTVSKNREMFIKYRDDNLEKFKRILYAKLSAATINEQKSIWLRLKSINESNPP